MANRTVGEMAKIINKTFTIYDERTGEPYSTMIMDARESWGKLQVQVGDSKKWFEPNHKELLQLVD
jgi:hypothetical protein